MQIKAHFAIFPVESQRYRKNCFVPGKAVSCREVFFRVRKFFFVPGNVFSLWESDTKQAAGGVESEPWVLCGFFVGSLKVH